MSSMSALLLVLIASSLLSLPLVVDTSMLGPDARALLHWKSTLLSGNRSIPLRSWTPSTDPCTWVGITCAHGGGAVAEINLPRAGLIGNLDSLDFSSFPFLTLLRLRYNYLSGPVPSTIGSLPKLASLDLAYNMMSGILPPSLTNLSQISQLDLSANEFHGPIPSELGKLCNLNILRIDNNGLTGPIPSTLGNLTKLRTLYLYRNTLSGTILLCASGIIQDRRRESRAKRGHQKTHAYFGRLYDQGKTHMISIIVTKLTKKSTSYIGMAII